METQLAEGARAARFYEPQISSTSHFEGYTGSLRRMSNIETSTNAYYPRKESATRKIIKQEIESSITGLQQDILKLSSDLEKQLSQNK